MRTYWKATYNDGTALEQYPENGKANTFRDIDQDKIISFSLYYKDREYSVLLEDGRKLIYTKRCVLSPVKGLVRTIYIIGWQKNIGGENVQSISFIEGDRVVVASKWGEGLFGPTK